MSKTNEIPRRSQLEKITKAEMAIYIASQVIEKLPADTRLTNAVIKLSEARNLVADYVDKIPLSDDNIKIIEEHIVPISKQYLLQYHLSRRSDEGWGKLALVFAKSLEEALDILDKKVSYHYTDAFASEIICPDNIICLNI